MNWTLEKDWDEKLGDYLNSSNMQELKKTVSKEYQGAKAVHPDPEDIFKAFSITPFKKVKVVIVGQDPYHGKDQAEGLCFSVKKGMKVPPSLRNIYKELATDLGIQPPSHGSLVSWAKQGVLLLNATLTVRSGEPKSHFGYGWEDFTDEVIYKLCEDKEKKVFVLWGSSAKLKCEKVLSKIPHSHVVLTSAHPSPLSAYKFYGCKHFSKINEHLKKWNKTPIDWRIE